MSSTAERIDAKAMLNGWLQGVTQMFVSDIDAIPDEKWNANFGGCTRTTSALTADGIGLLFWVAEAIRVEGTPSMPEGGSEQLAAACETKTGAIAKLREGSRALSEALMGASDETLMKPAMAPWNMEMPLFSFAEIAASHLWYHDGQLNYIQCLLGDGAYHWAH